MTLSDIWPGNETFTFVGTRAEILKVIADWTASRAVPDNSIYDAIAALLDGMEDRKYSVEMAGTRASEGHTAPFKSIHFGVERLDE